MSQQDPSQCLAIESLDLEAQGIAHRDGKVIFVDGALPFEKVWAQVNRKKESFEKATLTAIYRESSQRVQPHCPHFGMQPNSCGGCKMQHLHIHAQVAVKQRALEDGLRHIGKTKPQTVLRPIEGPELGYRYRARLAVRYVHKKQQVLIGFHERKSRYVADIKSCAVLAPRVARLLLPLRELIGAMQARETIAQIEVACGDEWGDRVTALVLRHLEPLSTHDLDLLKQFAVQHQAQSRVQWWLQPQGLDSVHRLDANDGTGQLSYALPEFGVVMPFQPLDFTQVNPHINRVLVSRALRLLAVAKHERVIDWFCGLGNFTLPLATQAAQVVGIEGSALLVQRARDNWQMAHSNLQQPQDRACFAVRNLFDMTAHILVADGTADKWLVDPPREGAFALVKALADAIGAMDVENAVAWSPPSRIVYVSCNPATLARDAEILVHGAGYQLVAAGVINMFPHTAHVESIAVFERA